MTVQYYVSSKAMELWTCGEHGEECRAGRGQ